MIFDISCKRHFITLTTAQKSNEIISCQKFQGRDDLSLFPLGRQKGLAGNTGKGVALGMAKFVRMESVRIRFE